MPCSREEGRKDGGFKEEEATLKESFVLGNNELSSSRWALECSTTVVKACNMSKKLCMACIKRFSYLFLVSSFHLYSFPSTYVYLALRAD